MLSALHIRNYVLIDSLDIDFPDGLVIITGQTGAGKSILLGALGLVLGGKADASVVSEGGEKCVVEAEFRVDGSLQTILEEQDVDWDGGKLVIRRIVSSTGRSRSFVNDSPVNVQFLQELASGLVDIHSQHGNILLRDRGRQLALLDHFAGCDPLRDEVTAIWRDIRRYEADLRQVSGKLERLSSDKEYNLERLSRLERANLKDGELEVLEEEHRSLAHAEEIKENVAALLEMRENENFPLLARLRDAVRNLARTGAFIPQFRSLGERLDSARIEIEDIFDEIQAEGDKISLSEGRLEQVEERMALLYDLLKRYSCSSISELIAKKEEYSVSVDGVEELGGEVLRLKERLSALQENYGELCGRLHRERSVAAPELASLLQHDLRELELDSAVFEIVVSESDPTQSGTDQVDFLFSSSHTRPVPVEKCASGGEISRIMLCLKAVLARFEGMPTLVFDEIDSGVSGSVAAAMGSKICAMGADMQVFAITHLPQVAAKGKAHYLVSKSVKQDGRTASCIKRIEDEARVAEIARLLSGAVLSEEALANARVLLSE